MQRSKMRKLVAAMVPLERPELEEAMRGKPSNKTTCERLFRRWDKAKSQETDQ